MDQTRSDELKRLLPHMRRNVAAALDDNPLKGSKVGCDQYLGAAPAAYLHRADQTPTPLLLELHGGGFALGDARKGDALRQWICDSYGVSVMGLEYRKAPEDPFPASLNDVLACLRHVRLHAAELGVDPKRVFVIGYSAGACLALAAALAAQDDDEVVMPAGLVLHYPFVDADTDPDDMTLRDEDLSEDMMRSFNNWYLSGADPRNPLVSPLFASDKQLKALPPVVMFPVKGDALKESSDKLLQRMKSLGCDVTCNVVSGSYHGYIEDAENLPVYLKTTMPGTIASRPASFADKAAEAVTLSLEPFFGKPAHKLAFPNAGRAELEALLKGGAR